MIKLTRCKYCQSEMIIEHGTYKEHQRYYCHDCKRITTEGISIYTYPWTKEELTELYWTQSLNVFQIADIFHCGKSTVDAALTRLGIPKKIAKGCAFYKKWNKEEIERLYWKEKLSTIEIAKRFNSNCRTICFVMRKLNIKRRTIHEAQLGDRHWRWCGEKREAKGYVFVRLKPDDFYYSMASKAGWVLEHRLVIAKSIRRCLHDWEIVHHINGIKNDNKIENLQLVTDDRHKQITILETKIKRLESAIIKLKSENQFLKEQQVMGLVRESLKEGYKID